MKVILASLIPIQTSLPQTPNLKVRKQIRVLTFQMVVACPQMGHAHCVIRAV